MGDLFRRYWMPALRADELPEPDCAPVRVQLLSERLVAFRDSEGRLGLIDEFCAHRGVSLWFGRNEQSGLRCPYHGWKYDVTGQCLEVPSEPQESGFYAKMKLKSYPLVERGGILWAYMGPPESKPALPEFEFAMVPEGRRYFSKRLQETNYLQAMEGGIDSSHTAWLHRGSLKNDPLLAGATKSIQYGLEDFQVHFEVVPSEGGLLIGARRKAENGNFYWRITQWVVPNFVVIPPRGEIPLSGQFWVPIDDEHCWMWSYHYHPQRDLSAGERQAMADGFGIHPRVVPGTFVAAQNKANDYLIDRAAQKAGDTFSGVEGIAMQDASLQETMGPIADRTKENLVTTDNGIIMARQHLRRAAQGLEKGVSPPGLDPRTQRVRSVAIVLPPDRAFKDAAREELTAREGAPITSV
jgi:phenylpropionate dioxygenase-like ring-hydroxylating dioxygenase large terminal subunit